MTRGQSLEDRPRGSVPCRSWPFTRFMAAASRRLWRAACAAVRLLRRSRLHHETFNVTAARMRLFKDAWHAVAEAAADGAATLSTVGRTDQTRVTHAQDVKSDAPQAGRRRTDHQPTAV